MKTTVIILLISTVLSLGAAKLSILSDEFIRDINNKQKSWVAGRNFPEDTPDEYLKSIAGAVENPDPHTIPLKLHKIVPEDIPESFDARTKWPECESTISHIRNQGGCGSCWAFSAVEVMTDRLCIESNGTEKIMFSPEHVVTCCGYCGSCKGGSSYSAFGYWRDKGLVSGGDYGTKEGCQPYQEDPFKHGITPNCSETCLNSNYTTSYSDDKHFGSSRYGIKNDMQQIQTEIMQNGPVVVTYKVYEDFFNYKSGVYVHTSGDYKGGHAVKAIGWGTENGLPYWLIVNSWGSAWGDKGFFKILRGKNEVGIEAHVVGATARV